ncbi:MAG: hypothetical protein KUA35_08280 [Pseudodesulfovibrio sp.]|uniref:hypothetical protein n=1 Tax=Pseudodesulfovibrio TaxID=2035811 RepID=UPI0012FF497A|nr:MULTISPECIES: hypothetical protein [Pseudodesulfovibrio]MBU4244193.1 hypothetical protein [Pseudomonadota bacterium]MBU4378020.1 hypothetical protein [Pseudomonadota bacterium]MBU4474739.1 hypothetical protein [Pseudomonadota bacterium]MBU4515934.1 hypothetical protein [Pseudomonadota bacterium]MBU4522864.1 hypothetical protein [Pseudomonadota bacterium]
MAVTWSSGTLGQGRSLSERAERNGQRSILKRNSENFIGQVLALMFKNTRIVEFGFLILRVGHQVMITLRKMKSATSGVAGRSVSRACPARACGFSAQAVFFKDANAHRLVSPAGFFMA